MRENVTLVRILMLLQWRLVVRIFIVSFALFLSQAVFPQPNSFPSDSELPPVKSLGSVDYVEINTLNSSGQAKQLIIFVHGTPGSLTAFTSYLTDPVMQEKFHMISVTRPGWRHDDDKKVPFLEEQAAALEPFLAMDQSGKGVLLMGHSYGGPVIARAAMEYPDKIAGLIFVAATADPKLSRPRWYNRFAVVLPQFLLGASLKGANAEIMPLLPQLKEMLPHWQDLTMPVLIVQGGSDRLVHPDNARFMERVLVNSEVRYLHHEEWGHFVLWEEAELIRDNIIDKFYDAASGRMPPN